MMHRDELRIEVEFAFKDKRVWECMDCCLKPEDIVDFILKREAKMLEEIEKPLNSKASLCLLLTRLRCLGNDDKEKLLSVFNAIDEALSIISKLKGEK